VSSAVIIILTVKAEINTLCSVRSEKPLHFTTASVISVRRIVR
jgi:hypothetical protein